MSTVPGQHFMAAHQTQALLSALTNFIAPVVHACVSKLSGTQTQSPASSYEYAPNDGAQSVEQELLGALERFVTANALEICRSQRDISATKSPSVSDTAVTEVVIPAVPELMRSQELPALVVEKTRMRVFNQMPIRMLVFDKEGSGVRLLERPGIISHILSAASIAFDPLAWSKIPFYIPGAQDYLDEHQELMAAKLVNESAKYAILSHEWIRATTGQGDIVYGEWKHGTYRQDGPGYSKITNFCRIAAQDHGITLGWMDTLCINKESSSELDESIRSMYNWYRNAGICIAHMSQTQELENMHSDSWFTRGWTLQELLAPKVTVFYAKDWTPLVKEVKSGLQTYSAKPSAIDKQIQMATTLSWDEMRVYHHDSRSTLPLSRVMQLAASRYVTRTEDQVYSLMGLLGVEISIAYGEGSERALFRLMREVLTWRRDLLDIFNHRYYMNVTQNSLLPSSISDYRERLTIFDNDSHFANWQPSEPILLTHLGLRMSLLLVPALQTMDNSNGPNVGNYKPLGSFCGSVVLAPDPRYAITESITCSLLDQTIYETEGNFGPNSRMIVTLAVLNFTLQKGCVHLPKACLAIPLFCGNKVKDLGPLDPIHVLPQPHPTVFEFQYNAPGTGMNRGLFQGHAVPVNELERHGMQLVTLYM